MEVLVLNVFNAVYQENLPLLKDLIHPLSKSEIQTIVKSKLEGTTLLLIATRYGYYDIIKFLIDYCDVDIEQVGKVEFDGETVDDTPPLWCAAAAGNINCVKLLIEHGANVNCTTHTNSTPLRAACFDGHFEIVKYLVENGADIEIANKHGHTCLMISCFKRHYNIASYLIEQGCQINRQSVKGNTALHDCAESDSMDIMRLLIKNGAIPKRDCFGLTPLMTACINGNVEIFHYLKSVFHCTIEEETDGYRLLGATFVDKLNNLSNAFKYWRKAASLTEKCNRKYINNLINKNESFKNAYNNCIEFRTKDDLDNLLCDPELMKYQAMIIRERILTINHPDTYFFIRVHGASFADVGKYSHCFSLWMYNLEQQQNNSLLNNLNDITQNIFLSLIELFTLMYHKKETELNPNDIFEVLKIAISQILISCNITTTKSTNNCSNNSDNGGKNINNNDEQNNKSIQRLIDNKALIKDERLIFNGYLNPLDRQFLIVIRLIEFMCQLKMQISPTLWTKFEQLIRNFLSNDPRSANSQSLLHIICILSFENDFTCLSSMNINNNNNNNNNNKSLSSIINVFRLIIDLSINLNIVDIRGNTALHYLLDNINHRSNLQMVKYLVDSGAHIDLRNDKNLTPLDLLENYKNINRIQKLINYCKINYVTLKCLCAQTLIKNGIKFNNNNNHIPISNDIKNFIIDHQSKDFFSTVFSSSSSSY